MPAKSHYRPEYQAALETFRTLRERTGKNQTEFAILLGRSQTFVSAAERGAVRLDALQIADWVLTCKASMEEWGRMMDQALRPARPTRRRRAAE